MGLVNPSNNTVPFVGINGSKPEYHYFTFPITLITGGHEDIRLACANIMDYCIYSFCHKNSIKPDEGFSTVEQYFSIINVDESCFDNGRLLFESLPSNLPTTSIKTDLVFEFRDSYKSELEIMGFLALAALKSILYGKSFCRVTSEYLVARMAGNVTINSGSIPTHIAKYISTPGRRNYQLDKLKKELRKYGVKDYSYFTHGTYYSTSLTTDELVIQAELLRSRNLDKKYRKEVADARRRAIHKISEN